ncbi:hypothetical protein, partial [Kribbella sp.]|uniref:hypothetical protein n=1 Tax=Kribbella sp. TaxID=1871183 RepID=UPI002D569E83
VGAVLLVLVNWPGTADSRKLWYDPDPTGWYLYRTWSDPALLASVGALAASLAARWAGAVALGVVAGCVVSLLEDGIVVLGGGISADETTAWAVTTGICLLMVFALMTAARRQTWPLYPVPPAPAALVGTGGVLLVVGLSITDSSGYSLLTVTPLFLLKALVAVALAWSALAAVEARMRSWLTTAAVTLAVLGTIGAVPTWTRGHSVPVFVFYLAGAVLLVVGVLIPGPRLRSRP